MKNEFFVTCRSQQGGAKIREEIEFKISGPF